MGTATAELSALPTAGVPWSHIPAASGISGISAMATQSNVPGYQNSQPSMDPLPQLRAGYSDLMASQQASQSLPQGLPPVMPASTATTGLGALSTAGVPGVPGVPGAPAMP